MRDARAAVQAAAPAAFRHAAGYDAALVPVAMKVERDAFPEVGTRRILQVQVYVGLAAVAGVADAPEQLARLHPVAGADGDRSRLQVTDEEVLARRHLDAHMIAETGQPQRVAPIATSGSPSCDAKTTPGAGAYTGKPYAW